MMTLSAVLTGCKTPSYLLTHSLLCCTDGYKHAHSHVVSEKANWELYLDSQEEESMISVRAAGSVKARWLKLCITITHIYDLDLFSRSDWLMLSIRNTLNIRLRIPQLLCLLRDAPCGTVFAFDESRACSWPRFCMQSDSYRTVWKCPLKANHGSGFNRAVLGAGQQGIGCWWLWIFFCSMESPLLY